MLVFCVATRIMHTNIRNAQSCERLASADIDRCTAMKFECTRSWTGIPGSVKNTIGKIVQNYQENQIFPSFCIGKESYNDHEKQENRHP